MRFNKSRFKATSELSSENTSAALAAALNIATIVSFVLLSQTTCALILLRSVNAVSRNSESLAVYVSSAILPSRYKFNSDFLRRSVSFNSAVNSAIMR